MEKKHLHTQKQAEKPAVIEKGELRCIIDVTHPWLPLINLHCLLQVPPQTSKQRGLHLIYPQNLSDQLQFVLGSKALFQSLRQSTTPEQWLFFLIISYIYCMFPHFELHKEHFCLDSGPCSASANR